MGISYNLAEWSEWKLWTIGIQKRVRRKRMKPKFDRQRWTKLSGILALVAICIVFLWPAEKTLPPKRVQSTDPVLRLRGFETHLEMTRSSPFAKLTWSHIGPTNISGRATDCGRYSKRKKLHDLRGDSFGRAVENRQ